MNKPPVTQYLNNYESMVCETTQFGCATDKLHYLGTLLAYKVTF